MAHMYRVCAVILLLRGVVDGFFVGTTRAALATANNVDKAVEIVHATTTGLPSQKRWRAATDLAVATDTIADEVTEVQYPE